MPCVYVPRCTRAEERRDWATGASADCSHATSRKLFSMPPHAVACLAPSGGDSVSRRSLVGDALGRLVREQIIVAWDWMGRGRGKHSGQPETVESCGDSLIAPVSQEPQQRMCITRSGSAYARGAGLLALRRISMDDPHHLSPEMHACTQHRAMLDERAVREAYVLCTGPSGRP